MLPFEGEERLTSISIPHDEIQAHKFLKLLPKVRLQLLRPPELSSFRTPLPLQLVVLVVLIPFGGSSSSAHELDASQAAIEMSSSSRFVLVRETWPGVFFEPFRRVLVAVFERLERSDLIPQRLLLLRVGVPVDPVVEEGRRRERDELSPRDHREREATIEFRRSGFRHVAEVGNEARSAPSDPGEAGSMNPLCPFRVESAVLQKAKEGKRGMIRRVVRRLSSKRETDKTRTGSSSFGLKTL